MSTVLKLHPRVVADVVAAATRHGLEVALVAAIVMKESSGGQPWKWRPEARYPYLWNVRTNTPFRQLTPAEYRLSFPPQDFPYMGEVGTQEWTGQRTSWGPMQIMGATARELGFSGRYLLQLEDPPEGIEYGCRYLRKHRKRHELEEAISAYNAGSPTTTNYQDYVAPVLGYMRHFRLEGL